MIDSKAIQEIEERIGKGIVYRHENDLLSLLSEYAADIHLLLSALREREKEIQELRHELRGFKDANMDPFPGY